MEKYYLERKKKYSKTIPKYVKITKINLDCDFYKQCFESQGIFTVSEVEDILVKDLERKKKCINMVELKRKLDLQLAI